MSMRALLPLAVAALVAGCGSEPASDAERVTTTITDYLRLQGEGDAAKACGLLTTAGQRQLVRFVAEQARGAGVPLGGLTCDRAIGLIRLVAGADLLQAMRDAKVRDVAVSGDTATAVVVGTGDVGRRDVRLVRVGGDWRIAAAPGLDG